VIRQHIRTNEKKQNKKEQIRLVQIQRKEGDKQRLEKQKLKQSKTVAVAQKQQTVSASNQHKQLVHFDIGESRMVRRSHIIETYTYK
jgi:hypothetical protein